MGQAPGGEIEVAAARAALPPPTLLAQEVAMDAWHRDGLAPATAAARFPTLIAHGEEDVVIPPANAQALAAHWPDAQVELFPSCGHALMAQEPQRLVGLIAALAR
jgi:pimeloyl-ACP methyl ester carboxylesterase